MALRGLEDREALLRAVVAAGADAVIVSYGTLRDCRDALAGATPILKLDLTTLTLDGYGADRVRGRLDVDDALRLGAGAVLTYVQVGTPFELAALQLAGARRRRRRCRRPPLRLRDHAGRP